MAKYKATSNGAQRAVNSYLDRQEGKGRWHSSGEIALGCLVQDRDAAVPAKGRFSDIPEQGKAGRYELCG